ncbi:glutathione S-transferase family protein [Martelella sp. HB161492]|uniref:glutathione S-transferase family protein n=1 Tax=Martelella sp. HB161492 TaxID=2720726 RepID=UPI00159244F1|nr:glutathione S-transferase family protein [Martelella sp. HB161492]
MSHLILYDHALDENCYRLRLFMALAGIPYETVAIDSVPGDAHRSAEMRVLSPAAVLPVLTDDGKAYPGTIGPLVHLAKLAARTADGGPWRPDAEAPEIAGWLEFAVTTLKAAIDARFEALFSPTGGPSDDLRQAAREALRIMDDHMTRRQIAGAEWFVGTAASLADVALFPSFGLSRDFGVDHDEFPALRRWYRRFRALPGFITMSGIPDYH